MNDLVIVPVGALLAVLTIFSVRKYIQTQNLLWFLGVLIGEIGIVTVYFILFKRSDFINSYMIIRVLSVIISLPLGIYIFETKIKTRHYFGILLAIIAMFLLR
jgi:hypothetical protein